MVPVLGGNSGNRESNHLGKKCTLDPKRSGEERKGLKTIGDLRPFVYTGFNSFAEDYVLSDRLIIRLWTGSLEPFSMLRFRIYINNGAQYLMWNCAPFLVAVGSFATYVLVDPENNILDSRFDDLNIFYGADNDENVGQLLSPSPCSTPCKAPSSSSPTASFASSRSP